MKLEEVFKGISTYIHMERFVDQRKYSTFCEYSEVYKKFRPLSQHSSFDLSCFLVPMEVLYGVPKNINTKSLNNIQSFDSYGSPMC